MYPSPSAGTESFDQREDTSEADLGEQDESEESQHEATSPDPRKPAADELRLEYLAATAHMANLKAKLEEAAVGKSSKPAAKTGPAATAVAAAPAPASAAKALKATKDASTLAVKPPPKSSFQPPRSAPAISQGKKPSQSAALSAPEPAEVINLTGEPSSIRSTRGRAASNAANHPSTSATHSNTADADHRGGFKSLNDMSVSVPSVLKSATQRK